MGTEQKFYICNVDYVAIFNEVEKELEEIHKKYNLSKNEINIEIDRLECFGQAIEVYDLQKQPVLSHYLPDDCIKCDDNVYQITRDMILNAIDKASYDSDKQDFLGLLNAVDRYDLKNNYIIYWVG